MPMHVASNYQKQDQVLTGIRTSGDALRDSIGKVISAQVTSVGDQSSIRIAGRDVAVPPEYTNGMQPGDFMDFRVEQADEKNVVLKAMNKVVGADSSGSVYDSLTRTQVLQNTREIEGILSESDIRVQVTEDIKNEAEQVSRFSADDLRYLKSLGIDVSSSDLSHLAGLVNQHRAQEEGREFKTGSPEVIARIARASEGGKISPEAAGYIISNGLDLSMDNIYSASHSAGSAAAAENYGGMQYSEDQWQELKPQVTRLLENQGAAPDENHMDAARFLMEHNLDVTPENMDTCLKIQDYNENGLDQEKYAERVAEKMNLGENPGTALVTGDSALSQVKDLITDVRSLDDRDVAAVADEGKPVTIGNLIKKHQVLSEEVLQVPDSDVTDGHSDTVKSAAGTIRSSNDEYKTRASGDLLTVQLRLTLSAGYRLMGRGVHISDSTLSHVIEKLDELSAEDTGKLAADSAVNTDEYVSTYQSAMTVTAAISGLPMYALGDAYSQSLQIRLTQSSMTSLSGTAGDSVMSEAAAQITLSSVYSSGVRIARSAAASGDTYETVDGQISSLDETLSRTAARIDELNDTAGYDSSRERFRAAFARYEELMTSPRSDMGDSISKAFAGIGSMLEDMGLADTRSHERAVKILAYNHMEITADSVENMSLMDYDLGTVLESMTPEVVLGMIRDGRNPLDMGMRELKNEIARQEEKQGLSRGDRYSTFLRKLDQRGGITSEERESYIGMYRLINQVSSYSGRDLGALVNSGTEVTLSHLLSAHLSRRHSGRETVIDDSFGMLTGAPRSDRSVEEQIRTAYDYQKINEDSPDDIGELQDFLRQLEDTDRESVEMLREFSMPATAVNLAAARTLQSPSGEFFQMVRNTAKPERGSEGENRDTSKTSDVSDNGYTSAFRGIGETLKTLEEEVLSAGIRGDAEGTGDPSDDVNPYYQATQGITEIWNRQMEAGVLPAAGEYDLRTIRTAMRLAGMSYAAPSGSRQGDRDYFIPISADGGRVYTMNLHLKRTGEVPSARGTVSTDSLGVLEFHIRVADGRLETGVSQITDERGQDPDTLQENESIRNSEASQEPYASDFVDNSDTDSQQTVSVSDSILASLNAGLADFASRTAAPDHLTESDLWRITREFVSAVHEL